MRKLVILVNQINSLSLFIENVTNVNSYIFCMKLPITRQIINESIHLSVKYATKISIKEFFHFRDVTFRAYRNCKNK